MILLVKDLISLFLTLGSELFAVALGPDGQANAAETNPGLIQRAAQRLPAELHGRFLGVEFWQYMALGMLLLVALLARKVLHFVVMQRVRRMAEALGQSWATRIVDAFASPGATLLMALMLRLSYPVLGLPDGATGALAGLARVLIVVSLAWAAYALVDVVTERMSERAAATDSKLDDQLIPLLRKSLKLIAILAGVLLVLQNMEVDVGSLIAGLGLGGLAFALAAKDTLANFFGSVMIFADRPFQIGDWVVAAEAEGIVEEVGFRSTRIRTFYDSVITLPNSVFTESKIDNYGARNFRRTSLTLNLTYDTTAEQMEAFVEGVRAIIEANAFTRKEHYHVYMCGFGAHSLDVMVYFFFRVPSWAHELRERHDVFLHILRLATALGVRFAFPTQTLHVDSLAKLGQQYQPPAPLAQEQMRCVIRDYAPRRV
ncbi:MAG: mechanosensitive ion channel domain-containing protein [Deltaproteobacteria bacterium]